MFEIYKSYSKRKKTYIVSNENREDVINYTKKYFKVSKDKIVVVHGWLLKDELYLEDPHNKKAHTFWVGYLR